MLEGIKKAFASLAERMKTTTLSESEIAKNVENFKLQLISNDVAVEVAERLAADVVERLRTIKVPRFSERREAIVQVLEESLSSVISEADPEVSLVKLVRSNYASGKPTVVLFVGPNGGGKTTSVVKVSKYLKSKGLSSIIACSDTYRAGAVEQLRGLAESIGVRVVSHKYGGDPAAVALDAIEAARAARVSTVLIDTAGRTEVDKNLLEEMRKIKRVSNPDIVIYVGDALAGNVVVEQVKRFNEYVGIDYIILAKLDADTKGGSAISVGYMTGKPILFVGTGQGLDDLEPLDKKRLISMLLGRAS
ncbi:MAG: signal recognition particle-docking protein FtsY [Candidatus Terraquivivens tikiterensis]|uniref:Signal recognition particle-docking protein FtsY n=1 Tax=Candidatus Terraquivivens tikiterensis TaxID=1980982 RepID=A0A2R7YAJ7_9ARCH|nr:MAG: signal recognition particle-docking protein FtsY [Candidatus Terraquivivens tikiterensis]